MKTHEFEFGIIKELLRNNPKGMKITRIARELAMNRNAAAKYLEILLMTGQVEMFGHGMSKIFILSRKTGIPTMLDSSGDMILVLDNEMKITRVNDNYLKFAGLGAENLLGKQLNTPGLTVVCSQPVQKLLAQARFGADIRTECRELHDGREFFFALRMTPAVFNDGSRGITIIIRDMTQEKKKENSLKESEANFRMLFGESPVGTAVFGPAGELLTANPAFPAGFGARGRDERSVNLFSLPGILPEIRDALNKGKHVKFTSVIDRVSPENSGTPDQTQGNPVFEFQVKTVSLSGGERQTGYLVQVMEAPVRSPAIADRDHSLLAEILSCIDEAVILIDYPSGSISFVNRPAEKVFGCAEGEFRNQDPSRILGIPGSLNEYIGNLSGAFEARGFFERESPMKRHTGESFPARLHLRPIYGDDGTIRNIVAVINDMTRRKEAQSSPLLSEDAVGAGSGGVLLPGLGNRFPTF